MNTYIWDCGCCDCGHEFEYTGSYPPIECEKCGSEELRFIFIRREYDW
jgi:hypothetical protein|nr:MAG TPA: hypothetical protein [Caudoviricetes sp.]